ncbi:hypothetical protein [Amycolatopsis sp.]|uniref:hypothetical protein n=1 Tax=Amycolatopsis sp. TaxID=37632 RepID=UPI002CEA4B3B|nr:hypothetical protein [Amycolatopsis sp.]HVV09186.1 hypothetical protein [Amycolatopsis sp.]
MNSPVSMIGRLLALGIIIIVGYVMLPPVRRPATRMTRSTPRATSIRSSTKWATPSRPQTTAAPTP